MDTYTARLDALSELAPREGIPAHKGFILGDDGMTVEAIKAKEMAIAKVVELYVGLGDAVGLRGFLTELRPLFVNLSKAKTAKIVRSIIDSIAKIPNSVKLQVGLSGHLASRGRWRCVDGGV